MGADATEVPSDFESTLASADTPGNPYAKALALQRAGFVDEAADELRKAVEATNEPIPEELRDLRPGTLEVEGIGTWREFRRRLLPAVLDMGELVATVAAVFLGFFLGGYLLFVLARTLFRATLGRSRWVRDALHLPPSVALAPLVDKEDKTGPKVAARIREELCNLDSEAGGAGLTYVDAPAEQLPLPSLADLSKQFRVVDAMLTLIQRFAPLDRVSIAVVLHPAASMGAGLTVSLSGGIRRFATTTLWEETYDPARPKPTGTPKPEAPDDLAERYDRLAVPAAVWLMYQLRRPKSRAPLGTEDWQSYALFKAGAVWIDQDEPKRAKPLLTAALNRDPKNIGAQVNRARLDWGNHERAVETNRCVREQIEALARENYDYLRFRRRRFPAEESYRWDPLWYRPKYNEATSVGHLYYGTVIKNDETRSVTGTVPAGSEEECEEMRQRAITEVIHLVVAVEHTISDLEAGSGRMNRLAAFTHPVERLRRIADDKALLQLLDQFEGRSLLVLAALRATSRRASTQSSPAAPTAKQREDFWKQLTPSVDHRELIELLGPFERLHPASTYNLACYLSVLAALVAEDCPGPPEPKLVKDLLDLAIVNLRMSSNSTQPRFPSWIRDDPLLRMLRTHDESKITLAAMLADHPSEKDAEPAPRASISDHVGLIGPSYAGKLKRAGVVDKRSFVEVAENGDDLEALAAQLQLDTSIVARWARMADLLDLIETRALGSDLAPGYAVLFDKAGVRSVADFQGRNPAELARCLRGLNNRHHEVDGQPMRTMVEHWWSVLQEVSPRVS